MKNVTLNTGLLILRLAVGAMMILHGIAKISHGIQGMVDSMGFFAYAVYVGEVIAPLMLIIGFRSRIAAALIAVTMAVAVFTAHSAQLFTLGQSGGWSLELQGLYFFAALAIAFTGAGKFAVSSSNPLD